MIREMDLVNKHGKTVRLMKYFGYKRDNLNLIKSMEKEN
jgi:hypothetical protein